MAKSLNVRKNGVFHSHQALTKIIIPHLIYYIREKLKYPLYEYIILSIEELQV
jgi:hypothetical protein